VTAETVRPVVIKIGGTATEDPSVVTLLFREIGALGIPVVVVHGGGKTVSALSRNLGIEPEFRDGIRRTSVREMELVDMGLAGAVNTSLVRLAVAAGLRAVGLSGADDGMITGTPVDAAGNRTAQVSNVEPRLLGLLLAEGILPILAPVASGSDGRGVNINADEAAQAIAVALHAKHLVFLSDIPGVLDGERVLSSISTADIDALVADRIVSGGMTAKLRSCAIAIGAGIEQVTIGRFADPNDDTGDLVSLIQNRRGTTIHG